MGWLTKALSPENPSSPLWPTSWLTDSFSSNDAGVQLSELNSRSASGVLACVRVISEAAAAYPKEIYQDLPDGKRLAKEHSLYSIINGPPNPQMTNFVFWVGIVSQACIWGNGYAEIQRDGANRAVALWPLPSGQTYPKRINGILTYETTATPTGAPRSIRPENIIHLPFLSFDGLQGYSPIQLRRQGLALSMAAERFGAMLFGKGARPSGVLQTTESLTPEKKASMRESWQQGTSGSNAMGVALLEPGVTFKALTIDPKDAQFLETRKYQLEEISRDFRVPAHMIGLLERATHSNAEQLGYDFSTYTMLAWVLMIEQELNRKLFAGKFFCKLDMDIFLRGDFETRMAGYQIMRNCGVLHANNICGLEAWPLIPDEEGGNIRIVPLNMISLEQLKKQEDEPPQPAPAPGDDATLTGSEDGTDGEGGNQQKEQLRARFAHAFSRLFSDATGRTLNREKRDKAFAERVWLPVLHALGESLAANAGKLQMDVEAHPFIGEYVGVLANRCMEWKKADAAALATAEFDRAYTALKAKV